jgi:hypothetical protein
MSGQIRNMDNSTPTPASLEWLRGDLHNHCEKHELIPEHLLGVEERLDFMALTNHAQKPIFFEQHQMIEQARALLPNFPIFFGLEWNAAAGRHAGVIFPPGPREAEHAYAFSKAHDRHIEGSDPSIDAALAHLNALPADERPIMFFNHPIPGDWCAATIDHYLEADGNQVVAGIEAVHGHQAHEKAAAMDPFTYPGGGLNGLADHVYQQNRPFALLAHSDFHVHKQPIQYDYPLGIFNHTLVGVEPGARDPAAIFAALRAGRTCATQGRWLDLIDCSVEGKYPGDTWRGNEGSAGTLTIVLDAGEDLDDVEVIGRFSSAGVAARLHSFGPQKSGRIKLEFEIPPQSCGYLRLRATCASRKRPAPGPDAPKLFQTSAIFLDAG